MALEGYVNSDKYQGRYYQVSWTATQNASTNKSTISWKLYAKGGSANWYAERTLKVVVAGTTVFSKTARKERYTGLIDSGTVTVTHADDGTKSFSISVKAAVYVSSVNCTGSKTFTLNTIARASTISSVTSSVSLGSACSVTFTPKSTSFYYKVKFVVGSWSVTNNVGKPGTTSAYTYKYTIPIDVANQIKNATSATVTVYLYTYSSSAYSTQIGSTSSKTATVTVPTTVVPTLNSFSATIVNTNQTINNWGIAVSGYTQVKFTGSGTGAHGSTISSFVISDGLSKTVNGTSLSYTSDIITSSGDFTFKALCKDTRSRSSSQLSSSVIKFYPYSAPSISDFTVDRSSTDATKITVKANWSISDVNNLNSATATIQYKKPSEGDSGWKNAGTITKNTSTVLTQSFDESSSYNIRVVVQDKISSPITSEILVPTKEVLLNFRAGGKGLGIGRICEADGLEVGFDSRFDKNVDIAGNISAANLGRSVYSGSELITDYGAISTNAEINISFYVIYPFNLVYFRLYVYGLTADIAAKEAWSVFAKIDNKFKPAYNTALATGGMRGSDAMLSTTNEIRIIPRNGVGATSNIYINGIYPLSSSSELYI